MPSTVAGLSQTDLQGQVGADVDLELRLGISFTDAIDRTRPFSSHHTSESPFVTLGALKSSCVEASTFPAEMMKRRKVILEEEGGGGGGGGKNYSMEVLQGLEDIVCGILLKLPVKSLLICKSVCKEWRRLISSPYFMNRYHLTRSPRFIAHHVRHATRVVEFDEDSFDEKTLPLSYSFAPKHTFVRPLPVHTCFFDGFICWLHVIWGDAGQSREMIHICNPATRELLSIGEVFYDRQSQPFKIHIAVACFGPPHSTSTSTNKLEADYYKVYAFFIPFPHLDHRGRKLKYHLKVYSSMTKKWKAVGRVRHAPPLASKDVVSVNGTIYWFPPPCEVKDCIFAIDWEYRRENVIRRIRLPPLPPWYAMRRLLSFQGCLSCILWSGGDDGSFELWVLKEDDLWFKRCSATIPVQLALSEVAARKNEIYFSTPVRRDLTYKFSYKSLRLDVDTKTWKEDVNWLANITDRGYQDVSAFSETLLPCH